MARVTTGPQAGHQPYLSPLLIYTWGPWGPRLNGRELDEELTELEKDAVRRRRYLRPETQEEFERSLRRAGRVPRRRRHPRGGRRGGR